MQRQRTENSYRQEYQQIDTALHLQIREVSHRGNRDAEDVDQIHTRVVARIELAHRREERRHNAQRSDQQNEDNHKPTLGKQERHTARNRHNCNGQQQRLTQLTHTLAREQLAIGVLFGLLDLAVDLLLVAQRDLLLVLAVEAAEQRDTHADQEHEIEERDDDIVRTEQDIVLAIGAEDRLQCGRIDHTAGVHTRHNAAQLCSLLDVATEEQVADHNCQADRQKSARAEFDLQSQLLARECAAEQHHRDRQRHHNVGDHILQGFDLSGQHGQVADDHTDGIKHHNWAHFTQQREAAAEPQHQRGCEAEDERQSDGNYDRHNFDGFKRVLFDTNIVVICEISKF